MFYTIKSLSYKKFVIEKNKTELFYLIFKGWGRNKAYANIGSDQYDFEPQSVWGTKYRILKNGTTIGSISCNWKGQMLMDLLDVHGKPVSILLKQRGVFKSALDAYLDGDQLLMTLFPKYKWFKVNYKVEIHDPDVIAIPEKLLIGILGYGAKLLENMAASG